MNSYEMFFFVFDIFYFFLIYFDSIFIFFFVYVISLYNTCGINNFNSYYNYGSDMFGSMYTSVQPGLFVGNFPYKHTVHKNNIYIGPVVGFTNRFVYGSIGYLTSSMRLNNQQLNSRLLSITLEPRAPVLFEGDLFFIGLGIKVNATKWEEPSGIPVEVVNKLFWGIGGTAGFNFPITGRIGFTLFYNYTLFFKNVIKQSSGNISLFYSF